MSATTVSGTPLPRKALKTVRRIAIAEWTLITIAIAIPALYYAWLCINYYFRNDGFPFDALDDLWFPGAWMLFPLLAIFLFRLPAEIVAYRRVRKRQRRGIRLLISLHWLTGIVWLILCAGYPQGIVVMMLIMHGPGVIVVAGGLLLLQLPLIPILLFGVLCYIVLARVIMALIAALPNRLYRRALALPPDGADIAVPFTDDPVVGTVNG